MSGSTVPAEIAERALAAATGPCIVLVSTTREANLRWAASTLTTNGLTSSSETTVVAVQGGDRVGVVTRSGVGVADVAPLVAAAEAAARESAPAEDAAELVAGTAADDFAAPPGEVAADDLAVL